MKRQKPCGLPAWRGIFRRTHAYRNTAVLYRTNAQSRAIEEGLRRENIPYQMWAMCGFTSAEKSRMCSPTSNWWSTRAIPSVFGACSTRRGAALARHLRRGSTILPCARASRPIMPSRVWMKPTRFPRARPATMRGFYDLIEGFRRDMETMPRMNSRQSWWLTPGICAILRSSCGKNANRAGRTVEELLTDIQIFVEQSDDVSLEAYLRKVSLVTDVDQWENAVECGNADDPAQREGPGISHRVYRRPRRRAVSNFETGRRPREFGRSLRGRTPSVLRGHHPRRGGGSFCLMRCGGGTTAARCRVWRRGSCPKFPKTCSTPGSRSARPSNAPRQKSRAPQRVRPGESFLMDVGSWVVHPAWGRGQIQSRTGSGQTAKLKVKFNGGSVKTAHGQICQPPARVKFTNGDFHKHATLPTPP